MANGAGTPQSERELLLVLVQDFKAFKKNTEDAFVRGTVRMEQIEKRQDEHEKNSPTYAKLVGWVLAWMSILGGLVAVITFLTKG